MANQIKLSDAIRFLEAKGVSPKCPRCGHNKIDIVDEINADVQLAMVGFRFPIYDINQTDMFGVYMISCAECGYVRLHARTIIAKWIANNPPN